MNMIRKAMRKTSQQQESANQVSSKRKLIKNQGQTRKSSPKQAKSRISKKEAIADVKKNISTSAVMAEYKSFDGMVGKLITGSSKCHDMALNYLNSRLSHNDKLKGSTPKELVAASEDAHIFGAIQMISRNPVSAYIALMADSDLAEKTKEGEFKGLSAEESKNLERLEKNILSSTHYGKGGRQLVGDYLKDAILVGKNVVIEARGAKLSDQNDNYKTEFLKLAKANVESITNAIRYGEPDIHNMSLYQNYYAQFKSSSTKNNNEDIRLPEAIKKSLSELKNNTGTRHQYVLQYNLLVDVDAIISFFETKDKKWTEDEVTQLNSLLLDYVDTSINQQLAKAEGSSENNVKTVYEFLHDLDLEHTKYNHLKAKKIGEETEVTAEPWSFDRP